MISNIQVRVTIQPFHLFDVAMATYNKYIYRYSGVIAKYFGGKIFWRIAENMSFGGIYFGG